MEPRCFWANAHAVPQKGNSPSAVAVRCQIHLIPLRLPPHERGNKQTCWPVPLNQIVDHCAVVFCSFRQRGCESSPHKCAALCQWLWLTNFGVSYFEGGSRSSRTDGLRWDCSVKQTCQWHVCSASRSGYAARKPANSRAPRMSQRQKREVRNRRGFGDLLGTFQSIEKYLARRRNSPTND